eukprot:GFUD01001340.1.p1 GENE.GFUD01001340.1~~GFUD01001340.1.p1  ORF type:complete len:159 (+),score=67.64 GFUD01001340.1:124-600(+)
MKVSVALGLLCLLLISAEGKRNGRRGGRGGRNLGGKKRVWHVADGKEQCGNYTKLMEEEKPADLCTEESTKICICSTKDDLSVETVGWQFRCGSCDLKWRPVKDEAEKEKRKTAAKEKRRTRRMERIKLRRKLNRKSGKKEKAKNRKNKNKNKKQNPE